jgi:hypothetical protein
MIRNSKSKTTFPTASTAGVEPRRQQAARARYQDASTAPAIQWSSSRAQPRPISAATPSDPTLSWAPGYQVYRFRCLDGDVQSTRRRCTLAALVNPWKSRLLRVTSGTWRAMAIERLGCHRDSDVGFASMRDQIVAATSAASSSNGGPRSSGRAYSNACSVRGEGLPARSAGDTAASARRPSRS